MDTAEIALVPHASKEERGSLCRNRAEFDASLLAPMDSVSAAGEAALLREIGGTR